jgi:hypothetical protein
MIGKRCCLKGLAEKGVCESEGNGVVDEGCIVVVRVVSWGSEVRDPNMWMWRLELNSEEKMVTVGPGFSLLV